MKQNKLFVLVALVLAVGAFIILKGRAPAPTPAAPPTPPTGGISTAEKFARPHSTTYGNSMGRVAVVEWFDPECEACRAMHPIFKKIVTEYQDRVRFVLRYMPYHENSMFAATALEEAKEHGKYDQALDLLFEKQPEWGDHQQPRPELIATLLASVGVPKDRLDRAALEAKHGAKIRQDEADGKDVGVQGTPSYFVNGVLVQELGEAPLREAIEAALKDGAQ